MTPDQLATRLMLWASRLDDGDLTTVAAHVSNLMVVPRRLIEQVRDRLDRAQERNQFSEPEDQQDLAAVITELDQLLSNIPAN